MKSEFAYYQIKIKHSLIQIPCKEVSKKEIAMLVLLLEIIENNGIWNDFAEGRNSVQFSDNSVGGGSANSREGVVVEVEEESRWRCRTEEGEGSC